MNKSNNFELLKGELAIAKNPPPLTDEQLPDGTICFKVGPGNFQDLEWCYARAADVHLWAKKSEAEFKAWLKGEVLPEILPEVITEGSEDGTIKVGTVNVKVHNFDNKVTASISGSTLIFS